MERTQYDVVAVDRNASMDAAGQLRYALQRLSSEVPHYEVISVVPEPGQWLIVMRTTVSGP